jgi:hypothetical protein
MAKKQIVENARFYKCRVAPRKPEGRGTSISNNRGIMNQEFLEYMSECKALSSGNFTLNLLPKAKKTRESKQGNFKEQGQSL